MLRVQYPGSGWKEHVPEKGRLIGRLKVGSAALEIIMPRIGALKLSELPACKPSASEGPVWTSNFQRFL